MWGLLVLQLAVLLALAATSVQAKPNEDQERQHAIEQAEFQKAVVQSKLASLTEQVAVAEREEQEVKANLDASKARVKSLRKQRSGKDLQRTIDEQQSELKLWPGDAEFQSKELALLATSFLQLPFEAEEEATVALTAEAAGRTETDGSLAAKLQQTRHSFWKQRKNLLKSRTAERSASFCCIPGVPSWSKIGGS